MRYFFLIFCFIIKSPLLASDFKEPLKIYIFCEANQKGLEKDRNILVESLRALNCHVEAFGSIDPGPQIFGDVNIFVQQIDTRYLNSSRLNWFIPNPEWYLDDMALLKSMDLILCRTKEVERIFSDLKIPTYYLSFRSEDHLMENVKKKRRYLHVAGSSSQKGTRAIKYAWAAQSKFPYLTILRHNSKYKDLKNLKIIKTYIDHDELVKLQNQAMIHLCFSETEGFGHSIMEAMSARAVVVTTDAPPMNEFILDKRFVVPFSSSASQKLATNYYVESADIENCIKSIQKISKQELREIGNLNRQRYLEICDTFNANLKKLIEKTLSYE